MAKKKLRKFGRGRTVRRLVSGDGGTAVKDRKTHCDGRERVRERERAYVTNVRRWRLRLARAEKSQAN